MLCGLWRNWVLPPGPSVGMLLLHSSTTFWTYHSGACLSLPRTYHRGTCPSLSVQHPGPTIRVLVFHCHGHTIGVLVLHCQCSTLNLPFGCFLSLPRTYHRGTCPSLSVQHPGPAIRVLVFHYQCSPQDRQWGTCPSLSVQHPGPTIRVLVFHCHGHTIGVFDLHCQCSTLDLP